MLKPSERALFSDPGHDFAASAVSIWELKIKWEKRFASGERKGAANPVDVLRTLRARNVPVEPLTPDQASALLQIPTNNNDPFDEQLLIHAQELGMRLLTRDEKLADHQLVVMPR
jgi:PIN domain nuclease of toxin-antitoxin system